MNIEKFIKAPELVEVFLDSEEIIKNYDEPISFWTYDIVKMDVYFQFFEARAKGEMEALGKLIKTFILNEKGEPVLTEGKDLPIDIMTEAIVKVGDILGKSRGKKSTQSPGKAPK